MARHRPALVETQTAREHDAARQADQLALDLLDVDGTRATGEPGAEEAA